jgi:hypothetical protein
MQQDIKQVNDRLVQIILNIKQVHQSIVREDEE